MGINLRNSCIAQWKFNETGSTSAIVDSIGDHDAILMQDASTEINASVITDSSNALPNMSPCFQVAQQGSIYEAYPIVPYHSDFSFGDGVSDSPFSISLWIKFISFGAGGPVTRTTFSKGYQQGGAGSGAEYRLYTNGANNLYYFAIYSQGNPSVYQAIKLADSSDLQLGTWYNVVCTYDGSGSSSGMSIYINGAKRSVVSSNAGVYVAMEDKKYNLVLNGEYASGATDYRVGNIGYLDTYCVFSKELSQEEVNFLYNDGNGTEELIEYDKIDEISGPSLTYPNGGEKFTEESINITWVEPSDTSSTEYKWYEIFITDDSEEHKKSELLQIGTIPAGKTSYSYTIQKNLRGKRCRIGIRSVNHEGKRSKFSFSAGNFIIQNESLPSPALMEPTPEGTYFAYLPFIFDHNAVKGRCSQRALYQVYYKSDNQDIDWTLLKSNIKTGTDPVNIDISHFNTDSDYSIKVELVDGDNVSLPVFINNVNINNINTFLIDTTPPRGTISVVGNDEYTKETSFILSLSAVDDTSAVKDVQIQQTDLGVTSQGIALGEYTSLSSLMTFDLKGIGEEELVDGVKLIQVRYRDYGDNTIETSSVANYFRTYKSLENREVSVFLHNGTDLYYTFVAEGSSPAQLYKNLTFVSTLDGEATALHYYNGILYVAIKDEENKGILQRLSGGSVNTVSDNDSQYLDSLATILNSLYLSDSVINAMEVFDNKLFLGLENGSLLSFSGATVTTQNDDYLNVRNINNVRTDGNLLYILFDNTTEILIMNKDIDGNYFFNIVDTES